MNGPALSFRKILTLSVFLECGIILLAVWQENNNLEILQTVTRYSELLCLCVFTVMFLFQHKSSIVVHWLSNRYYLLFAVVSGIHLIELFILSRYLNYIEVYPVIEKTLASLIIFVMPVIQYYPNIHKWGWIKLHVIETAFIYSIWAHFFIAYLLRVLGREALAGGSYVEHVALLGWISVIMGYQLSGLIRFKN